MKRCNVLIAWFALFFLAPLAGGVATQLLFGEFTPGLLVVAAVLGAVLIFKPDPLIEWLDSEMNK